MTHSNYDYAEDIHSRTRVPKPVNFFDSVSKIVYETGKHFDSEDLQVLQSYMKQGERTIIVK